jgi:predicted dienelactone hydrolase
MVKTLRASLVSFWSALALCLFPFLLLGLPTAGWAAEADSAPAPTMAPAPQGPVLQQEPVSQTEPVAAVESGEHADVKTLRTRLAGLDVAIWSPPQSNKAPLVVFSHGFHGTNTQSIYLMKALALAGYFVAAPNHRDAGYLSSGFCRAQMNFNKADKWSDQVYADRREDILKMLEAIAKDERWKEKIDWTRVALCGHSLGGYTALGMGGAWPSWKLPDVKAVLALSPYCLPFTAHRTLSSMTVPVMYQGGTRDPQITPTVVGPNGAFSQSASPAYFVEFNRAGHQAWTNYNHNKTMKELIISYCLAFLDKYVKGSASAAPDQKLDGTAEVLAK